LKHGITTATRVVAAEEPLGVASRETLMRLPPPALSGAGRRLRINNHLRSVPVSFDAVNFPMLSC
jgi:hypothetical protein